MTRRIGDRTGDELDTRASRIPSVVPAFVPDRVLRRRRALRALREGSEGTPGEAAPAEEPGGPAGPADG